MRKTPRELANDIVTDVELASTYDIAVDKATAAITEDRLEAERELEDAVGLLRVAYPQDDHRPLPFCNHCKARKWLRAYEERHPEREG